MVIQPQPVSVAVRIGVIDVRTGAIRRKRKTSSVFIKQIGQLLEGPLKARPLGVRDALTCRCKRSTKNSSTRATVSRRIVGAFGSIIL